MKSHSEEAEAAFLVEGIKIARILATVGSGVHILSFFFFDLFYAGEHWLLFLFLRVISSALFVSSVLSLRLTRPKQASWLWLRAAFIPISIAIMLPFVDSVYLGLYVAGYVMSLFAIAVLMLWRPKDVIFWAGITIGSQLLIFIASNTPLSKSAYVLYVISSVLMLGIISALIRRQAFMEIFEKSKKIQDFSTKIQIIFENIDHAIFYIILDSKGEICIETQMSPAALAILDETPRSFDEAFLEKIDLSREQKSMMRESILAMLDSDELAFDLNSMHLPEEVLLKITTSNDDVETRHLKINYSPIVDSRNIIKGLIIVALDDTMTLKRQKDMESKEIVFAMVLKILETGKERMLSGYSFIAHTLSDLKQKYDQIDQSAVRKSDFLVVQATLLPLHTMKGNARTLGLNGLSSSMHELETCLVSMFGREKMKMLEFDDKDQIIQDRNEEVDHVYPSKIRFNELLDCIFSAEIRVLRDEFVNRVMSGEKTVEVRNEAWIRARYASIKPAVWGESQWWMPEDHFSYLNSRLKSGASQSEVLRLISSIIGLNIATSLTGSQLFTEAEYYSKAIHESDDFNEYSFISNLYWINTYFHSVVNPKSGSVGYELDPAIGVELAKATVANNLTSQTQVVSFARRSYVRDYLVPMIHYEVFGLYPDSTSSTTWSAYATSLELQGVNMFQIRENVNGAMLSSILVPILSNLLL